MPGVLPLVDSRARRRTGARIAIDAGIGAAALSNPVPMQQLLLRVGIPLVCAAGIVFAWDRFGWQGVLVVVTALVMWLLMHFNRMMQVLKRAANRPIGTVDSAVMLNAKLKPGVTLLHVTAMTQSLGQLLSEKDRQPELYRWSDNSQSYVDGEFRNGKLVRWQLERPESASETAPQDAPQPAAPRKIGRFSAAVSEGGLSSQPNPGPQRASDNKE